jgi:hypothetical protein
MKDRLGVNRGGSGLGATAAVYGRPPRGRLKGVTSPEYPTPV